MGIEAPDSLPPVSRLGTPLDAARAGLAVFQLLWSSRQAGAYHGVRVQPGDVARLRRIGGELAAAVEAAERAEEGALDRVASALEEACTEVARYDSVAGLLSEARRRVCRRPLNKRGI